MLKEEFVGCPKWMRAIKLAGSDAIVMWLAIKLYASTHPTNGFVPDEEVELLRGAPRNPRKALKALVECGAIGPDGQRGAGLVEPALHGWQMHDYTEHANSSEHELLRKEKARDRKRQQRERERLELEARRLAAGVHPQPPPSGGTYNRDTRDSHGVTSVTVTHETGPVTSGVYPGAPGRAHEPNPTQPNQHENNPPPKDLSGSAPEEPAVVVAIDDGRKVPCPPDLALSPDQVASLEIGQGMNAYQAKVLTGRFCANFGADQTDLRPLTVWLKCLSRFVSAEFANPKHRPPRAPDQENDQQTRQRVKHGPRQPNGADHADLSDEEHLRRIGGKQA